MKSYQAVINEIIETAQKWKTLLNVIGKQSTHVYIPVAYQLKYYQSGDNYFVIETKGLQVNITLSGVSITINHQIVSDFSQIRKIAKMFAESYKIHSEENDNSLTRKKKALNNQRENKLKELSVIENNLKNINEAAGSA